MSVLSAARRQERFERLFDDHYGAVAGYARRRAGGGDADDVVAETFLTAWRRLEEVPADAKPWLLGVARRVLANQRRAAGRRAALADRVAHEPQTVVHTPEGTSIARALAGLSEGDREVLLLAAWDGLSSEETAAVLGCSKAAAQVRLHRAKRRLRTALQRLERDEPARTTRTRLEECHDE
jgi:RNA polymerase sigma-70 factor (ECF subfamily)